MTAAHKRLLPFGAAALDGFSTHTQSNAHYGDVMMDNICLPISADNPLMIDSSIKAKRMQMRESQLHF